MLETEKCANKLKIDQEEVLIFYRMGPRTKEIFGVKSVAGLEKKKMKPDFHVCKAILRDAINKVRKHKLILIL